MTNTLGSVEARDKTATAGAQGKWPKLKLSAPHAKLWAETRAAVLWTQPAFADIWYSMMVDRDGEQAWFTDQIPTCATDDKFMYVNPSFYFGLTLEERVLVACHEISHAMFNHCGLFHHLRKAGEIKYSDGVTLPYDDRLMQAAADFAINAMLVDAKVGKMPKQGCLDLKLVPSGTSALDAYRILYKKGGGGGGKKGKKPDVGRACKNSDGTDGKSFDEHLEPGQGQGKTPSEAEAERNPQQWENAIAAAMTSAKLRGNLPGNLERMFLSVMEPKTDWSSVYLDAVSRKIGNDAYSWECLDQEMIVRGVGSPGRVQFGCELVIVARDSSGSINDKTCAVFGAETRAILEQIRPKRVILVDCDYVIHRWEEVTVDQIEDKVRGGGGTSFVPVFKRIESEGEHPDLLIYLTDLYGDQHEIKEPNYPVIWGCINETKGPWGQTVYVPEQADEDTV